MISSIIPHKNWYNITKIIANHRVGDVDVTRCGMSPKYGDKVDIGDVGDDITTPLSLSEFLNLVE